MENWRAKKNPLSTFFLEMMMVAATAAAVAGHSGCSSNGHRVATGGGSLVINTKNCQYIFNLILILFGKNGKMIKYRLHSMNFNDLQEKVYLLWCSKRSSIECLLVFIMSQNSS